MTPEKREWLEWLATTPEWPYDSAADGEAIRAAIADIDRQAAYIQKQADAYVALANKMQ